MKVVSFGETACEKVRGYLDSYLSNELMVETNHEVLKHLEGCPECAAELNARARVRTALQTAARTTPVPPGLEAKVQRAVRAERPRRISTWYMVAAAAVVIICMATFELITHRTTPEQAILNKAQGRLAELLNIGLRDHLHCAVFRKYSKQPETFAQMAAGLGPEFAGLGPVIQAKMPTGFRIIQGHRCTAGGKRTYIHFIALNGTRLLSLVLTPKQPDESLNGLSQEGVDRYQVVGFESHGYLVYVISDLDAQQNLQLAANMAPTVREYLAAHQG
jgi:anti-sigma factor (TIGR02949 family)